MNNPISVGIYDSQSFNLVEYKRRLDEVKISYKITSRIKVDILGHNIPQSELIVSEKDFDQVEDLVAAVDNEIDQIDHSFCPNCDSSKIVKIDPKGFMSGFKQIRYNCKSCNHKWV